MVCFHPIKAYYPLECDSQGKRYLKFGRNRHKMIYPSAYWLWIQEETKCLLGSDYVNMYDSDYPIPIFYTIDGQETGLNIKVPCGRCIGCRLDYSRQWALRSIHEAQMHNNFHDCSFLTLTFNNDMLNRRSNPNSLNKTAFRSWLKRLRKAVKCEYNKEFRIMACGEYGSKHLRPHYHMLIYGFNFPDKYVYKYNKVHGIEVLYYRSPFLEKVWSPAYSNEPFGFSVIGDVNFESSAYVARYVTKKLFGKQSVIYKDIEPEFLTTSRMPGLGYDWLLKYYKEIFSRGFCYNPKGFKAPIPRYYVNKLQEIDENLYSEYRMTQFNNMCDNLFKENIDITHQRLIAREEFKKMNLNLLVRQYEFNSN